MQTATWDTSHNKASCPQQADQAAGRQLVLIFTFGLSGQVHACLSTPLVLTGAVSSPGVNWRPVRALRLWVTGLHVACYCRPIYSSPLSTKGILVSLESISQQKRPSTWITILTSIGPEKYHPKLLVGFMYCLSLLTTSNDVFGFYNYLMADQPVCPAGTALWPLTQRKKQSPSTPR